MLLDIRSSSELALFQPNVAPTIPPPTPPITSIVVPRRSARVYTSSTRAELFRDRFQLLPAVLSVGSFPACTEQADVGFELVSFVQRSARFFVGDVAEIGRLRRSGLGARRFASASNE